MQKLFLPILLIVLFVACKDNGANKQKETTGEKNNIVTVDDKPGKLLSENFYKRMEGTVAGKAVVVNISKFGKEVEANYYYTDKGIPIILYLNRDANTGDSIELIEYGTGLMPEDGKDAKWHLQLTEAGAKGLWISGDKKTTHNISLKENYPSGAHLFNTVGSQDSFRLAFKKDTVVAITKLMLLEPADAAVSGPWYKSTLLENMWGDKAAKERSGVTLAQMLKSETDNFIQEYKAEIDSMRKNNELTDSTPLYSLGYETLLNANLIYNDNDFAVMDVGTYNYWGGAHGLQGSTMICYDVRQKRDLELADVTSADSATLQKLLEKHFRLQEKIKPGEKLDKVLFENILTANDNFYFTHKGLGFVYQPYEIAAYVYGIINVFIPFTDMKQYLNPQFAQRIGLE